MSEEKTTQQLAYEVVASFVRGGFGDPTEKAADITKRVANAMDEHAKAKTHLIGQTGGRCGDGIGQGKSSSPFTIRKHVPLWGV